MALLTVHSVPFKREFQSSFFSRATFFSIVCLVLCVVPPLLVAYSTHGFWIKHQIYREQPVVQFKHKALVIMYSNSSTYPITWSTYSDYNSLMAPYMRLPMVASSERDFDNDGLMDHLDLTLDFETEIDETIHYFQLFIIFSYRLREVASLSMESAAVLQFASPIPLSAVHCGGDLHWIQRKVLDFQKREDHYEKPVFDQFELSDVLRNYYQRDYLTELTQQYYVPTFGFTAGTGMSINVSINYPEVPVEYAPSFWNTIKWAWIQYVAILLIFTYLIGKIKDVAFTHQIIPSWNPKTLPPFHQDMDSQ